MFLYEKRRRNEALCWLQPPTMRPEEEISLVTGCNIIITHYSNPYHLITAIILCVELPLLLQYYSIITIIITVSIKISILRMPYISFLWHVVAQYCM